MRQTKQQRRGKTSAIPAQHCPACLAPIDRASHLTRRASPGAGNLNVCIACAAVTMYDDGLRLRLLSDDDMASLAVVDNQAWQEARRLRQLILTAGPAQSHDTKTRH